MLAATLLASQMWAWACLFDCDSPQPVAIARTASHDQAPPAGDPGSCHRETDGVPVSDVSLGAAPHDCGSHASRARTLTTPRSISVVSPASTQAAILMDFSPAITAAAAQGSFAPHGVAPPGPGPRLIAPLRI